MKRLFEKLAKSACALMLLAELFLPLIGGIGQLIGRTLYLFLPGIEHETRAVVVAALAAMAFASREKMNRFARICAAFLPPVTFVCGFLALMKFTPSVNRITNPLDVICIALECVLAVCVFFRCAPRSALKIVMGVLSGILLPFVSVMLMFGLVFIDFGGCYESEPVISPDGRREAVLAYIDEGAMGGSDVLEIRERGAGVNILIGRLRAAEQVDLVDSNGYAVYVYADEEFVSLMWKDHDTLLVGGREVEVDVSDETGAAR